MNKLQLVELHGFTLAGRSVRTINRDEFNPERAKLPPFWAKFYAENIPASIPDAQENSPVYGVYSHYESDANGYYTVTAGVKVNIEKAVVGFDCIKVPAGRYLVFSSQGAMPEAVIKTWQAIWAYFTQEPAYTRSFLFDFEVYLSANEVAVYIGVD